MARFKLLPLGIRAFLSACDGGHACIVIVPSDIIEEKSESFSKQDEETWNPIWLIQNSP